MSLQSYCILFKLWCHQKSHSLLSTLSKKEMLYPSLQWFSVFLEEIDLRRICLDIKSTDFVVGKHLWWSSQECHQSKLIGAWCVIFQQINGISLCVGKAEMKICERSLQALLSSAFCSFAARSHVLSRLSSLAIHGGFWGHAPSENFKIAKP